MTVFLGTYQGVNDASWKYVIGHEVGHTIQHGLFGLHNSEYQLVTDPHNVCNCSHIPYDPVGDPEGYNDDHCIQSKEHGGSAANEGWGHFIALDLMNDDTQQDGTFIYYKAFRCPDQWPGCNVSGQMGPPLAFNGRTKYRWMDTHCATGASYRGIEVDWMNFYFAMHTTGGFSQFYFTQFRDTYRGACGSSGGSAMCSGTEKAKWGALVDAVDALYTNSRLEHWTNRGAEYGVDQ